MALETANTIYGLQSTNPTPTDPVSQGDDHLRLVKSVLKLQFPGAAGSGFAIPITAKEAEINYLSGVTSNIQAQLNKALFIAGTQLAFGQTTPPVGWTKITLPAQAMSVLNNVGGQSGGIHDPTSNPYIPTHSHTVNINTSGESGKHTHPGVVGLVLSTSAGTTGSAFNTADVSGYNFEDHFHNVSGNTGANAGTNWQPVYFTSILCVKS